MTSFQHLRVTQSMYAQRMVSLTAATSLENLRALNEVRDFATTDMGLGGPELWTYRVLQEPGLSTELQRLANPLSAGGIDAIDFQPCQLHEFRTQDRKCIEHWQMPSSGGTWAFTALFDGQYIWSALGAESFGSKLQYVQDMPDTPPWNMRFGRSLP